jgi:hypothetical protein
MALPACRDHAIHRRSVCVKRHGIALTRRVWLPTIPLHSFSTIRSGHHRPWGPLGTYCSIVTRKFNVSAWLDGAAVICLLFGETAGGLLFPDVTLFSLTPTFWLGVAALVVRHLIWPRPSLPSLIAARLASWCRPEGLALTLKAAVASRVAVVLVGLVVVLSVGFTVEPLPFRVSRNEIVNLPARFDAGWYLRIAREGYRWQPELQGHRQNVAFFPLYPALMRVAGDVVTIPAKLAQLTGWSPGSGDGRILWGGTLVSIVSFAWALRQLLLLLQLEFADGAMRVRALVLFAAYPFALFFSAPYSESAFLLLLISTVLEWRRGHLGAAAVLGLLTGLIRPNGWTMSAPLFAAVLLGPERDRPGKRCMVAACPVLGAALFSAYIFHLTGNPLEWMRAHQAWGNRLALSGFLSQRADAVGQFGLLGYLGHNPLDAFTLACVAWMLVMAAVLATQRKWLYAALIVAYVVPAVAIGNPSVGRMTSVLFPAFFPLAAWLRRRWCFVAVVVAFAVGQAYFAGRFFRWLPPF